MDDMQMQMNAILQNPEMMEKIAALAQSMGGSPAQTSTPPQTPGGGFPDIDMGMLQKLAGFAQKSVIDGNQQNLLQALSPYLKGDRIGRLEKAMRAAKLARLASGFLGSTNFFGLGR